MIYVVIHKISEVINQISILEFVFMIMSSLRYNVEKIERFLNLSCHVTHCARYLSSCQGMVCQCCDLYTCTTSPHPMGSRSYHDLLLQDKNVLHLKQVNITFYKVIIFRRTNAIFLENVYSLMSNFQRQCVNIQLLLRVAISTILLRQLTYQSPYLSLVNRLKLLHVSNWRQFPAFSGSKKIFFSDWLTYKLRNPNDQGLSKSILHPKRKGQKPNLIKQIKVADYKFFL
jgi:hypothetical protein